VTFDVNSKTKDDEEIVRESNYQFQLDIEVLLKNSDTTRLAERNRRRGINKIPRPQNAWIIYRRDKSQTLKHMKLKSKDLSKMIAEMWVKEPRETRIVFEALARMSEKIHIETYKDYKYNPKRLKSKPNLRELSKSKSLKSSKSKPKSPESSKSVTSVSESKPSEFKPSEFKPSESNPSESNPSKSNPPESNLPESNLPESNPPESNPPESNLPESNLPESNLPESNPTESNLPESNPLKCNFSPCITPVKIELDIPIKIEPISPR
jgi:hypothetical protein